MPGWHEATEELQRQGKVRVVGVIEEQHPERARLFMQWKGMEWRLLVDSLNLLEVPFVPITLLVDEEGKARRAPRLRSREEIEKAVRAFLAENDGGNNESTGEVDTAPDALPARSVAMPLRPATDDAAGWRKHGRRLFLTRGDQGLDDAVAAYEKALELDPDDPGGWGHFRLGVLLRARYDSPRREAGDFQAAVDHWRAALDRDPNNYIFRRRIQQYGPRLDKPYPFYDWVETARKEIREHGETPVELTVLPGGAEIAQPAGKGAGPQVATTPAQPDPEGRIRRDPGELVKVETTVVPGTRAPDDGTAGAMRAHLAFRPENELKVHWNNEAEGLTVWLDPGEGIEVEPRRLTVPNPAETLSREIRRVDFEVEVPERGDGAKGESAKGDGTVRIPGYALYYVCEDVDGTCLYRRQDLEVAVPVGGDAGSGG